MAHALLLSVRWPARATRGLCCVRSTPYSYSAQPQADPSPQRPPRPRTSNFGQGPLSKPPKGHVRAHRTRPAPFAPLSPIPMSHVSLIDCTYAGRSTCTVYRYRACPRVLSFVLPVISMSRGRARFGRPAHAVSLRYYVMTASDRFSGEIDRPDSMPTADESRAGFHFWTPHPNLAAGQAAHRRRS